MLVVAVKMGEGGGECYDGFVQAHVCCWIARGLNNTSKERGRRKKRRPNIQYNYIIVRGGW